MSTSPLFWLRPLFICLTSQLYLWEYIWSSQQILISLFGFLQIKAHLSKFNLVFRSHSVLESLRKFGLALNLWKWQCSEGVVWFGFNELFLSLFPDNSWCPCWLQIRLGFSQNSKSPILCRIFSNLHHPFNFVNLLKSPAGKYCFKVNIAWILASQVL